MSFDTLPRRTVHRYGWKRDIPDFRDLNAIDLLSGLPDVPAGTTKFSLRDREPEPCYDQGQLGSCTGNGVAFVVQFERVKQGLDPFRPSRLAIYYGERVIEGTVGQDAGAQIRDGIKVVALTGAGPENVWPYDINKFAEQPPQSYFDAAKKDLAIKYMRLPRSLGAFKKAIYNGFPVVKGFTVYESFESDVVAQTGIMPMPQPSEEILGGHCTVYMGWNDTLVVPNTNVVGALEDRNSWGTGWGDNGHFWTPYAFAQTRGFSSDFWIVTSLSS